MHIGYIGLGKMGLNMVQRLSNTNYHVSAYDLDARARAQADLLPDVTTYDNHQDLIDSLPDQQKIIWLMVPSSVVNQVIADLIPLLNPGDLVIDGGNTNFHHTLENFATLQSQGIEFIDIGVSGGPIGALDGACMMVGASEDNFNRIELLIADLCVKDGYAHVGKPGAGHFTKMVHNGIEYGMMQSIGEGFSLMRSANQDLGFELDLEKIAHVYNHGSVIESALINWTHQAFKDWGPELDGISGTVNHSGEGQWTVEYAESINHPVDNIKQSLQFRIDSVDSPSFAGKVVSALRNQFGGHNVTDNSN